MATYKEDVGTAVTNYAGNSPSVADGEVWYDSTNKDFKYQYPALTTSGSWRSGVDLNAARTQIRGFGTYTATIAAGGGPGYVDNTETWNGTNWTEVNNLTTGRSQGAGIGATSTAGLYACGAHIPGPPYYTNITETWNGTNWTEVNDAGTSRGLMGMTGNAPNTAALIFAGDGTGPNRVANTEIWNGTNWTEVNDLNQSKYAPWGAGDSSTAAICWAGNVPPATANTELWNGTNWTEVNNLNTAKQYTSGTGPSSTDAIAFGGSPRPSVGTQTELWNGTNWTETNDLSTAKDSMGGSGTTTNAMSIGGSTGSAISAVEEWTGAGAPVGAWATGGAMNTARRMLGSAGTIDSSLGFGGVSTARDAETESYNGTNWTEVNDLTTARRDTRGCGADNTAALCFGGGSDPSPSTTTLTETWNGSNWTEVNDLNTGRAYHGSAGINTAAYVLEEQEETLL